MPSKKLPYMQLHVSDWMADTAFLSLAARGFWMDLICVMHQRNRIGSITGSLLQIAHACRCSEGEAETALSELSNAKVANVVKGNGNVTVTCRRMQRAENERKRVANAVRKSRELKGCNGNVTPPMTEKGSVTLPLPKSPPCSPPFSPPLHSPSISPLISPQKFSKKALSIDNAKESQLSLPADFLDGLEMEEPERPKSFKLWSLDDLIQAVGRFPEYADIAGDFIDYWSEQTPSGKMRLHLEKAWDTKRRLRTWADRNRQMPSGSRNRPRERRPGI